MVLTESEQEQNSEGTIFKAKARNCVIFQAMYDHEHLEL